jgi:hypothetical protein
LARYRTASRAACRPPWTRIGGGPLAHVPQLKPMTKTTTTTTMVMMMMMMMMM